MEILEIKKYPDKVLCQGCLPVAEVTQKEIGLFEDMLVTMRNASGLGLAAPQIGVNENILVADIGEGPIKLANPQIIQARGKEVMEEGCLSVPHALVKVARPYEVVVRGLNEKGFTVEIRAKGLLARVLLHEIDHLRGKLIIDHMSLLQRLKFNLKKKIAR